MSNSSSHDPFNWGVERLSQELCGEGQGWAPASSLKRPDPAALHAALKEHEIDGETLLTWDDVFSSHNELFHDLGLVKAAHRMTVAKAIAWLKNHSPAYRQAKAEILAEHDSQMTDGGLDLDMPDAPVARSEPATRSAENEATAPRAGTTSSTVSDLEEQEILDSIPPFNFRERKSPPPEEPPRKKRRLAPQLISSEVQYVGLAPLPTAADSIGSMRARRPEELLTKSRQSYLGKGKLVIADYVPRNSLRERPDVAPGDDSNEFFWTSASRSFPPGRRLQMKRGMTRLFQANQSYAAQIKNNVAFMDERTSSPFSSEDGVLPLFGDSDDEYDAETLREMEEEASTYRHIPGLLSKDQAKAIIDSVIQEFAERWNDRKLERCQRKAHPLWRSASLKGRNQEILRATRRLSELEHRINKLVAELLIQDWAKESSLRRQSRCLEGSIEDRQYFLWLSQLLKGREPPRAPTAPRRPRGKNPKIVDLSDDDADFITSDSDVSDVGYAEQSRQASSVKSPTPRRVSLPRPGEPFELPQHPPKSPASIHSQPRDIIDLVTPESSRHTDPSEETEDFNLTPEQLALPFNRSREIGDINVKAWKQYKDTKRMTISFLWKKKPEWRDKIFKLVQSQEPKDLWNDLILPTYSPSTQMAPSKASGGKLSAKAPGPSKMQFTLARLFWQFAYCDISKAIFFKALGNKLKTQIPKKRDAFDEFLNFMRHDVIPNFPGPVGDAARQALLMNDKSKSHLNQAGEAGSGADDETDVDSDQEMEDQIDAEMATSTPSKRGRKSKAIVRDKDAERMQKAEKRRTDAGHVRGANFHSRMAVSKTITMDQARLIINISKDGDDDAGFIAVSSATEFKDGEKTLSIADRIKDHQIDGVRFMWDHMMANQGCLLAHTMGLGKTMQIITLLVAIREAASSTESSVVDQIPQELRGTTTKFLVLCPSGLCDNWKEEFFKWAPSDVFGESNIRMIDSTYSKVHREFEVEQWADKGGVLIIGYPMFRVLYNYSDKLAQLLTETADIVVADEAHYMKNRESKIAEASANIKTLRRLALTGTPLANNVGEFYSTINWLAPNYLGPQKEFDQVYVLPIESGLWGDSTPGEYRKAKKMLAALERTVAPKTHRLTAKCLKEQLPGKIEFVVTVPMLPLQAQLYELYISSVRQASQTFRNIQATSFAVTSNLILISNHPRCFYQKLLRERERRNAQSAAGVETPTGSESPDEDSPDHTITNELLTSALTLLNRQRDAGSTEHSWKVQHLVKILDECRLTREKVLVFSQSLITLDYLDNVLRQQGRSLQKLIGLTKPTHRQNMVKRFNEEPTEEVFLISTTAGGVGLNITGASRVVIFDFKYNPVLEQQAIGRAYRIGQTRRVVVYRFLAGGTHEQKIHNKAVFKQQLASRVVDKENPKRMAKSNFGDLVHSLKDVPQDDLTHFLGKDNIMDKMLAAPGSVRSLLLTDAFEEEDLTDAAFSAEERKEVERMYEMNRIRNTDPERYRLLENQRIMAQAAPQHQMLADAATRQAGLQQAAQLADAAARQVGSQQASQMAATQQRLFAEAASKFPPQQAPQQGKSLATLYPPQSALPPTPQLPGRPASSQSSNNPGSNPRTPPIGFGLPDANNRVRLSHLLHGPPPGPAHGATGFGSPVLHGQPSATPNLSHTPIRPPAPQSTGLTGSMARQPAMPMTSPGSNSNISRRPVGPSVAHGSASAAPLIPPGPRRSDPSPTPGTHGPMSSPTGSGSYEDRLHSAMLAFEERVLGTISRVSQTRGTVPMTNKQLREHASKAAQGIRAKQRQRDRGFLPDKARWNELIDVAASAPFCGALIDGKLDFEALAWGDIHSYCQSNGYGTAIVGASSPSQGRVQKDPNHLRKALSRSNSSQHATDSPKKGSRAHEDLIAMRQVADRRKHRPLPEWAHKAVEEGR